MATEYETGLLVGLLIGEGSFGGDGRQPQITLRMHVRHEALFDWLQTTFPGGKLYGPYNHGGRRYYQWMARGSFLRDELIPLIESRIVPELDGHAYLRFTEMRSRYAPQLVGERSSQLSPPGESISNTSATDSGERGEAVGDSDRGTVGESAESSQSALSRAESIFSRMREQGTHESDRG